MKSVKEGVKSSDVKLKILGQRNGFLSFMTPDRLQKIQNTLNGTEFHWFT